MNPFMKEAIKEAKLSLSSDGEAPFGAVIVKDNRIIGRGHNEVKKKDSVICHGEIMAINDACQKEGTYNLNGASMYSTSEPCSMCLGAILYAQIKEVYYGSSLLDNESLGLEEEGTSKDQTMRPTGLSFTQLDREAVLKLYDEYLKKKSKQDDCTICSSSMKKKV